VASALEVFAKLFAFNGLSFGSNWNLVFFEGISKSLSCNARLLRNIVQ
jgi:hypothetical protein